MPATKPLPIKRFAKPAEWQAWLDKHHATSPGVRLEFAKKGHSAVRISHAEALEIALRYGWIDGQVASTATGLWHQRFTRRGPRSKWSLINCATVERLQSEGRLAAAGLHQMNAAKEDGRWAAAYASPKTITVPADLESELTRRPRAKRFFEALDSKNRYAILYRLQDAKKAETRQRRLEKFVAMLEAGETLHERPKSKRRSPADPKKKP